MIENFSLKYQISSSGDFPAWSSLCWSANNGSKELGSDPSRVDVREFKSHSPHQYLKNSRGSQVRIKAPDSS